MNECGRRLPPGNKRAEADTPVAPALPADSGDPFSRWFDALQRRHLTDLRFAEVRRAVQALSGLYVEDRARLSRRSAFDSAGKRAAYALYYAPLHFLLMRQLVRALGADRTPRFAAVPNPEPQQTASGQREAPETTAEERIEEEGPLADGGGSPQESRSAQEFGSIREPGGARSHGPGDSPMFSKILDLGCGTGAAGAAWALTTGGQPFLEGFDRNPWAVREAEWTYRTLGLRGKAEQREAGSARLFGKENAVLAAFTVNEVDSAVRARLLHRLLATASRGASILIVEPISRRISPWWQEWTTAFAATGGRSDQWRFPQELPEMLKTMDRAAGLDHSVLTCRTLWVAGERTEKLGTRHGASRL